MTPEQRYQRDLAAEDSLPDTAQARVVLHTQRIFDELVRPVSLVHRAWGRLAGQRLIKYTIWGGVGRGKTYLMDTLFTEAGAAWPTCGLDTN